MTKRHVAFLALALALLPVVALAATPDRSQYKGAARLSDEELRVFLDLMGDAYPPGSWIPRWAPRFVALHLRAQEAQSKQAPAAPAELAATVGPNVNVSKDTTPIHSECFNAVDRSNPLRLIGASNQILAASQMNFWSSDGGATWGSVPMPLGSSSGHSDPGVAWDSKGQAYAVALGFIGNNATIQVSTSLNGGQTWGAPVAPQAGNRFNDKELMAANHQAGTLCQDLVCVAWDESGIRLDVACAVQATGGWNTKSPVTASVISADPTFGPNGEIYVAYANLDKTTLDFVKSSDCGLTWSAGKTISATFANYDIGIIAMCSRRALIYPAIDVDRSNSTRRGWAYVAWTDANSAGICPGAGCPAACTTNIRFSRSSDGGATWSVPTLVHTNTASVDQFNQWLAVDDSDGSINVSWHDTRDDATRKKTNVYYRRSTDGGTTWEPEIKVTTAQTDETGGGADTGNQYGDYEGIAAFGCKAWPFWTDRRSGGHEEIYTATVDNGPCGSTPCTATAQVTPPGVTCEGGTLVLDGGTSSGSGCSGGFQYRWLDTVTSAVVCDWSSNTTCTPLGQPFAPGARQYTLEMRCGSGAVCSDTDLVTATIGANPTADAGRDTTFCFGSPASLPLGGTPSASGGAGGYQYTWSIVSGAVPAEVSSLLAANPTYTPAAPNAPAGAVFQLVVKDLNNCQSQSDAVTIVVTSSGPAADQGNVLRATKTGASFADVTLAWVSLDPFAASFNVRRDTLPAFTSSSIVAPGLGASPWSDVNAVPVAAGLQLYYRLSGVNCAKVEGPF